MRFNASEPEAFLTEIFEANTRRAVKNAHHWGYTGASLTKLFLKHKFSSCTVLAYRVGKCPDLEKLDNRPDSLFFEAIR
jgi:hypothetical protein